ncbi:MAG TPA: hypothetical protein VFW25_06175 [Silvibacterium sp.]|nr:hypothetical protein [Silvibacterium sp.]
MRVTINLDDDALEYVDLFAQGRRMSRGRAVSELVRRGYNRPLVTHMVNGLHVITVPPDSPRVTLERIKEAEEKDDIEYARKFFR